MGFECKFVCDTHPQHVKFNGKNCDNDGRKTMYDGENISRCMVCEKYFKNTGKYCPCCGVKTRMFGRSQNYRKKRDVKRY